MIIGVIIIIVIIIIIIIISIIVLIIVIIVIYCYDYYMLDITCQYATYTPLMACLYTTIYYLCPIHLRLISCINPLIFPPPTPQGEGATTYTT